MMSFIPYLDIEERAFIGVRMNVLRQMSLQKFIKQIPICLLFFLCQ